jgi:hypothetical protein
MKWSVLSFIIPIGRDAKSGAINKLKLETPHHKSAEDLNACDDDWTSLKCVCGLRRMRCGWCAAHLVFLISHLGSTMAVYSWCALTRGYFRVGEDECPRLTCIFHSCSPCSCHVLWKQPQVIVLISFRY